MSIHRTLTATVLDSGRPSRASYQFLYRLALAERADYEPQQVLAELRAGLGGYDEHDRLFALAELSYAHAARSGRRRYFLDAAVYAYAFLFPSNRTIQPHAGDPRLRTAGDIYNRAIVEGLANADGEIDLRPRTLDLSFGTLALTSPGFPFVYAGYPLERFVTTDDLRVRGLRNRYHVPGIGAGLMASVGDPGEAEVNEWVGANVTVSRTMFVRLEDARAGIDGGQVRGSIEVYDVAERPTVAVDGSPIPLEHDPTMSLAYLLEDSPLWDFAIAGFRRGDFEVFGQEDRTYGLFMLRPFDPDRIPVVFVHGTASSPARWAEMVNELIGDATLRGRYQPWYFIYNTGNPVGLSGVRLRRGLTRAVEESDPDNASTALRHMVVVGHSQGGLLTKMTAIDAGSAFWDNVSRVPFEDADLTKRTRRLLDGVDDIRPLPFVRRVIFIATPHRGSFLAENWMGNIARRLVALPSGLTRAVAELAKLDPEAAAWRATHVPTSIDNMRGDNPFVQTLAAQPIAPDIAANSIIAVKGTGPPEEGNDGVVAYTSAHHDGVESELVVRSGHSTQSEPETIEEVRRILYRHLEAFDAHVAAGAAASQR